MKTYNNFYIKEEQSFKKINLNNSSTNGFYKETIPKPNKVFSKVTKLVNHRNIISIKQSSVNKKEKNIKVNKSNYLQTTYKKENNKLKKFRKRNRFKDENFYESTFSLKKQYNKSISPNNRNNFNINKKKLNSSNKKEFVKIILSEPPIKYQMKNLSNKTRSISIKKKESQNLETDDYIFNNSINCNTKTISEKDNNMSSKFKVAQEKWKKNYFASFIQKIFRGYYFRKIFQKKFQNKSYNNIYIKKIPKYENYLHKIKIKNVTLNNIKKKNKRNYIFDRTFKKDNISGDDIKKRYFYSNTCYNSTNRGAIYSSRDYSSKRIPKIKEIIITKRKNSPIVNINLNNCYYANYIFKNNNNYNIYNSNINNQNDKRNITYMKTESSQKYWRKINSSINLKKKWNHWIEVINKNKIIISLIKLKKIRTYIEKNKDIKSDDTYNTTNSLSEEKRFIHMRKNAKLFCINKVKKKENY